MGVTYHKNSDTGNPHEKEEHTQKPPTWLLFKRRSPAFHELERGGRR